VQGKRAIRHVNFDTNYWKSFVHTRLGVPMGEVGCLSLFGDKPEPLPEAQATWPGSCGLAGWNALPHLQRLLAAVEAPNHPVLRFRIGGVDARLLRIRQLWNDTSHRWSISSLAVRDGTPAHQL
jgi:hypothetical protein